MYSVCDETPRTAEKDEWPTQALGPQRVRSWGPHRARFSRDGVIGRDGARPVPELLYPALKGRGFSRAVQVGKMRGALAPGGYTFPSFALLSVPG